MTQLAISDVAVEFGATKVFEGVTFTVARGERWGVIGRNGSGKTTLFRLITGEIVPTRGRIARTGSPRIALLEQHRKYDDATTVWEAAAGPFAELLALERSLADQAGALATNADERALDRYARDLERFEREGGYTFAPRVDAVLHGLGFDPVAARTQALASLSGGERGRVGLARQLASPADVLLLDEPTNHLDLETTRWLEQWLRDSGATVLVVSHDRAFLEGVVDHVLHFESATATPYEGGYDAFIAQRLERRLTQQRQFDKQARKIASDEDYIRRNIAGQNSKQAKGRRKLLARTPRLSPPPGEAGAMTLRLEAGERGGDQVLVVERVRVAVPDVATGAPRTLLDGFSARVARGETIGLVGPNGAGKSTLLRAIVGERLPDEGETRLGGSVRVAYYDQELGRVPLDRTLYDIVADLRPQWTRGQVQGHLGRYGFSGDEVQRRAESLSGGERARVALAMMELGRANFLIFDEPTNHLDVESIEALEDALEAYDGTVLLVSHDRALLRALVERVWVLHDRHITDFPGTFAEWEQASREREHARAVAAAEEEGLRRVRERQTVQRRDAGSGREREKARAVRKEIEDLERRVASLEARVSDLTGALADPELYARAEGPMHAARLGQDLERAKEELDAALETWGQLVEHRG